MTDQLNYRATDGDQRTKQKSEASNILRKSILEDLSAPPGRHKNSNLESFDQVPDNTLARFGIATFQGLSRVPEGMWKATVHNAEHPGELLQTAAMGAGTALVLKTLLPKCGLVGKLAASGLGAFFTYKAAEPVIDAYKIVGNTNSMRELNAASVQIGDAGGSFIVNSAVAAVGYKLGARYTDRMLTSQALGGLADAKTNFYSKLGELRRARREPAATTTIESRRALADNGRNLIDDKGKKTTNSGQNPENDFWNDSTTDAKPAPERHIKIDMVFGGTDPKAKLDGGRGSENRFSRPISHESAHQLDFGQTQQIASLAANKRVDRINPIGDDHTPRAAHADPAIRSRGQADKTRAVTEQEALADARSRLLSKETLDMDGMSPEEILAFLKDPGEFRLPKAYKVLDAQGRSPMAPKVAWSLPERQPDASYKPGAWMHLADTPKDAYIMSEAPGLYVSNVPRVWTRGQGYRVFEVELGDSLSVDLWHQLASGSSRSSLMAQLDAYGMYPHASLRDFPAQRIRLLREVTGEELSIVLSPYFQAGGNYVKAFPKK